LLVAPAGYSVLLVRTSSAEALELVALDLARTIEESGQDVVVVDADLETHVISSRLGYDQRLGIRDILTGDASILQAAHPFGRTGIKIVPVGMSPLTPPDQKMRRAFSAVLRQSRALGRVIIDGGELGTTPSEFGLYAMVDEVVFLEAADDEQTSNVSVLVDLLRHRQIKAKAVFVERTTQTLAA